ncbi:hypothetical protein [Thermococcus aciditolerans]|uniref:Uncharacterized protein n=1 Tax=Thermococcus aciditolerans TaxID=2598455 RepID=A0A5C0SI29_9EURY|nr:hypothetical protein [Thermococcus aciditolerans]QEK14235.1 hypothetical protein FPV09_02940 [Thermococcus aciditolerans]
MRAGWSVEVGREDLLERLAELAKSGDLIEYRRFNWDDYGTLSLWKDELLVFGADVFLGSALEELALLNFHLLGVEAPLDLGELRRTKLEDDPFRRALAGENFDAFLGEHPAVSLGSYDPWIDLHVADDGKTLRILSLEWYGRSQELYFEVLMEEWLDSTVKLFAMVVRDFERMRETLLRYGFSDAPRKIGRYRALLRSLLDAYPVDLDALPPAYAPWEVEEVVRTASNFLFRGSVEGARCVLDSLKNPNHYRQALSRIQGEPKALEKLYRLLDEPYRSEMLSYLAYLYAVEGKPSEGMRVAEELGSNQGFYDLALGLIRVGNYRTALKVAKRIKNPWLRGEILMRLYSEKPELENEIKENAPEHVVVFIEERKKREH